MNKYHSLIPYLYYRRVLLINMELVVIGDTHIPSRKNKLPLWVRNRIKEADHTIHTGDFDSRETINTIRALASGSLTAVQGDKDPNTADLPNVASVEIEGKTIVITHGHIQKGSWEQRLCDLLREYEPVNVIGIGGHTHYPRIQRLNDYLLLNPGTATGASPSFGQSILTIKINSGLDATVEMQGWKKRHYALWRAKQATRTLLNKITKYYK